MPGYDPAVMMLLLVTLLVPTVGILMALTPFLMRRGEVFAVTVPAMRWLGAACMRLSSWSVVPMRGELMARVPVTCWL